MVTYSGWLKDQGKRQDAVGWFSRYWFGLEGRPRLSAVSSITEHLEARGLFQSVEHLTEAHDAAMKEYRQVRAGIVQAVQEQLPGPEHEVQEGAYGIPQAKAGEHAEEAEVASGTIQASELMPGVVSPTDVAGVVARATAAGVEAGERAEQRAEQALTDLSAGYTSSVLLAILKDLELVKLALGIARDADGAVVRFPAAVGVTEDGEDYPWGDWYADAVDGWDDRRD